MSASANDNSSEANVTSEAADCSINVAAAQLSFSDRAAGHRPTDPIRHLYIHIPFCARICPYCAFYKELLDPSYANRFCAAILREIEQCAGALPVLPRTIFFGGGTPTALNVGQLESVLRGMYRHLDLSDVREWTIEANPGSVSARKAALLRKLGVNRISLGVQSWDDQLLRILGREHNAHQAKESFRVLREAGFGNINIDLMFGLPGQTIRQWEKTLTKTIELGPEHISAYCLTYEEDTEFFLRYARGELRADADIETEFFELAMSMLQEVGYQHYEISNYTRHGYASAHNRAYWAGRDYLGIGPSAFSTVRSRRWQNVTDYRKYADCVLAGESAIHSMEKLTPEMKRTERIALGLRTSEGIAKSLLSQQADKIEEFVRLGLLRTVNEHVVLTRSGRSVADAVAEELI